MDAGGCSRRMSFSRPLTSHVDVNYIKDVHMKFIDKLIEVEDEVETYYSARRFCAMECRFAGYRCDDVELIYVSPHSTCQSQVNFLLAAKNQRSGALKQAKLELGSSSGPAQSESSKSPAQSDVAEISMAAVDPVPATQVAAAETHIVTESIPVSETVLDSAAPLEDQSLVSNQRQSKKKRKTAESTSASFQVNDSSFEEFSRQMKGVGEAYWSYLQQRKADNDRLTSDLVFLKKSAAEKDAALKQKDSTIQSLQTATDQLHQELSKLKLDVPALQESNKNLTDQVQKLTEERERNLQKALDLKAKMESDIAEMESKQQERIDQCIAAYKASARCETEFGIISGPLIGYGYTTCNDTGKKHDFDLSKMPDNAYYGPDQDEEAGRRFKDFAANLDIVEKYSRSSADDSAP